MRRKRERTRVEILSEQVVVVLADGVEEAVEISHRSVTSSSCDKPMNLRLIDTTITEAS